MMRRQWIIWLIVLLAGGLLLPAAPALADGDPPGVTIWGEDYILLEGEQIDGDLVVIDGNVTLEAGSRVAGSVVVWNGNAEAEGAIEGELVVSGGDIYLGDSAHVEGGVVCSWDCELEREDGARVDGGIVEGVPLSGLPFDRWHKFPIPALPSYQVSGVGQVVNWALGVVRGVASVLVVAVVAGLVSLIWPRQVAQVGQTVIASPGASFGIGLLTAFAGAALIVVLLLTICLSPAAVLAALALGVAGLFGWIGVGVLVGERLMQALNVRKAAPLWTAGLGTLLITLVTAGLGVLPCLGVLGIPLIVGLGCLGLGAVVLTRFGVTPYTPSSPALLPVEPPEPAGPLDDETEDGESEET
ncbi:MAG: hypothetical protein KKC18_02395 [Chloroflexi bacterium]|nr:hypothetical protein [Chloroflexota bacterium]